MHPQGDLSFEFFLILHFFQGFSLVHLLSQRFLWHFHEIFKDCHTIFMLFSWYLSNDFFPGKFMDSWIFFEKWSKEGDLFLKFNLLYIHPICHLTSAIWQGMVLDFRHFVAWFGQNLPIFFGVIIAQPLLCDQNLRSLGQGWLNITFAARNLAAYIKDCCDWMTIWSCCAAICYDHLPMLCR